MQLEIKQLFKSLLRPLTPDEREKLEESLVANGCEMPLVIWRGIIIDGHNRYEICQRLNIPFEIVDKSEHLADETAVMCWIYANALGQRSVTESDRKKYIGDLYNLRVILEREKEALLQTKDLAMLNSPMTTLSSRPSLTIANTIGEQFGVSGRTVQRYGQATKMGYENKQSNGDEFDQSMPDENYDETIDEYAQDQPGDDFNQAEPTSEQIAERKAQMPKRTSKSKSIVTGQKSTLRAYETLLNKMQGLRLNLSCDVLEPDYVAIHASIKAMRDTFPVPKKRFGK